MLLHHIISLTQNIFNLSVLSYTFCIRYFTSIHLPFFWNFPLWISPLPALSPHAFDSLETQTFWPWTQLIASFLPWNRLVLWNKSATFPGFPGVGVEVGSCAPGHKPPPSEANFPKVVLDERGARQTWFFSVKACVLRVCLLLAASLLCRWKVILWMKEVWKREKAVFRGRAFIISYDKACPHSTSKLKGPLEIT